MCVLQLMGTGPVREVTGVSEGFGAAECKASVDVQLQNKSVGIGIGSAGFCGTLYSYE